MRDHAAVFAFEHHSYSHYGLALAIARCRPLPDLCPATDLGNGTHIHWRTLVRGENDIGDIMFALNEADAANQFLFAAVLQISSADVNVVLRQGIDHESQR